MAKKNETKRKAVSSGSGDAQPTKEAAPVIRPELLEELLAVAGPRGLTGKDGLLKQLTAALVNKALDAEMSEHLGYDARESPPEEQVNRRNGHRPKKVRSGQGVLDVSVPRDREGSFEPMLVGKHQRHFAGFDDQILSMYARGMSTRDIQGHLKEIYGVDVSPDLVSRVTDAVVDELTEWQGRGPDRVYPVVYIDALVLKVRDQGKVENKAVHIVVGVNLDGERDVLGLWLERTEGAKFWSSVLTDLRERGVEDILILCADGLTGLPAAVEAVFPKAIFQTCIVHMIRASTRYVSYRDLKPICQDLKTIYLQGDQRRGSDGGARRRRDEVGPEVWPRLQTLANQGDGVAALSSIPARAAARHLHDQYHRGAQPHPTQDAQNARAAADRRSRAQADVLGHQERESNVGQEPSGLADGATPNQHSL